MVNDSGPGYVLALAGVFLALCPIFAGLRTYIRAQSKNMRFGVDDGLMLGGLLFVIGCCTVIIVGVKTEALSYTAKEIPASYAAALYTIRQKLQYVYFILHPIAMGCIKLSFVFLFMRIFVVQRNWFSIVCWITVALISLWTVAFTIWWIAQCNGSPSYFWSDHITANAKCTLIFQWQLAFAISDFVSDIWVLALPVPMVAKLHMSLGRKLAVVGMFALGLVALAASTTRLVIFNYLLKVGFQKIPDPDFDLGIVLTRIHYWATLEAGLAFIACCLPTLGPLAGMRGVKSVVASVRSLATIGSGSRGSGNRTSPRGTRAAPQQTQFSQAKDDLLDDHASTTRGSTTEEGVGMSTMGAAKDAHTVEAHAV